MHMNKYMYIILTKNQFNFFFSSLFYVIFFCFYSTLKWRKIIFQLQNAVKNNYLLKQL